MKLTILISLLMGGIVTQSPAQDSKDCRLSILKQISNGKLISDTLNLSGKYLNELGNYDNCVDESRKGEMKYELKVFRSDKSDSQKNKEFNMEYVMGICTFK